MSAPEAETAMAGKDGDGTATPRLVILGGVRQGTEIPLSGGSVTVGADLARDVVLSDPGLDDHQLTIVVDGKSAEIEIEAGGVYRDGEALEAGSRHPCDPETVFVVGELRFAIVPDGQTASASAVADGFGTAGSLSPANGEGYPEGAAGERASVVTDAPAEESKRLLVRLVGGGLVLVTLLVGLSYVWHTVAGERGSDERVEASPLPPAPLATRLAEAGFTGLATRRADDGELLVEGYVESRARQLELQRFLSAIEPPPRADIFVQSEIAEGVGDVYRNHGIDATVEPLESGMVKVSTAERQSPDFRALQRAALEDVPGLRAVQARNVAPSGPPPGEKAKTSPTAPRETPPGKRVVAIVEGDPSYVVTEDDARYFVGSSLPTGHTIALIENRSVTLDRDGERTQLRF